MPDESMNLPVNVLTHHLRTLTERYAICLREIRREGISNKMTQLGVVGDGTCTGQYHKYQ